MKEPKPPPVGKFIRLSDPRLGTIHINSDKILLATAEMHKVRVLVLNGKEYNWFERSCSLAKFLNILNNAKFDRVNKFYIINWNYLLAFNPKTRVISFNTKFSLQLNHTIKSSVFKARLL